MKTITLSTHWPRRPLLEHALPLIPLLLFCFAILPGAQAVGPDTEGNIPGSNNGEGIGVLVSRTNGIWNTGTGFEALNHLTAGNQNTATGFRALFSDTSGGFNTATGVFSLFSNTSGFYNSATGAYALSQNISGSLNTANGYAALYRNTANGNTATGYAALYQNTTGDCNTASGNLALYSNTTGLQNTADGYQALRQNTAGQVNTANGAFALFSNTIGDANTAIGRWALLSNTTGSNNTAIGISALNANHTGSRNIALGYSAGAGVTAANVNDRIDIGNVGTDTSGEIRIGTTGTHTSTSIAGISGATATGGVAVYVTGTGKLGTMSSSRRFKEEIKPMDQVSEAILALKPVTFHYKSDASGTPQFGLIAEEVAEVNPDLVVRNKDGDIYTVRYEAVNVMLLNEFLKEQSKNAEQEATIAKLQKQVEALTAGLQKVSNELAAASPSRGGFESSKAAPQMVDNNQ